MKIICFLTPCALARQVCGIGTAGAQLVQSWRILHGAYDQETASTRIMARREEQVLCCDSRFVCSAIDAMLLTLVGLEVLSVTFLK